MEKGLRPAARPLVPPITDAEVIRGIKAREARRADAPPQASAPAPAALDEPVAVPGDGSVDGRDGGEVAGAGEGAPGDEPGDADAGGVRGDEGGDIDFDSEAEDWAFGIDDAAAARLPLGDRLRRERIRTSCQARDRIAAASCLTFRPSHGRPTDACFRFAARPNREVGSLKERGRRLLNWRRVDSNPADAAQMAVNLALSWEHAESMTRRLGELESDELDKEVRALKERISNFEPEGIV
jgi:hypothetical protein